ncbi:hypothetical protein C8Q77DRAFT_1158352 [Trametes polyzona]|nr:hypothetical protein C8Q77DRAFT_1158352 [Trametes polyzona]
MPSFVVAALLAFFAAGQVYALNITIAGVGLINESQFLTFNDPALAACPGECNNATSAIQGCNGNSTCLCTIPTVMSIVACEQCVFNKLVADFRRPDDPRAGQTSAIAAYAQGCKDANVPFNATLTALAVLAPPPGWNGPFGQGLTTFGTVVSVAAATLLGSGLIAVVNTM